MFKPFFVHLNPYPPGKLGGKHPRGATIYVSPDPDNAQNAIMQATFCNPKDQFCKKEGRSQAMQGTKVSFNKRKIPEMVGKVAMVVHHEESLPFFTHYYNYLLRNFL